MKVEDFTHVLPEDKPVRQKFRLNSSQVYDLDEVNKQAKYYVEFLEQLIRTERNAKNTIRSQEIKWITSFGNRFQLLPIQFTLHPLKDYS